MRNVFIAGALLLATSPVLADAPVSKYGAMPRPAVVTAKPKPVSTAASDTAEEPVIAEPHRIERPILSLGPRCLRVLGIPLVCL